ncbi:NAD(P)-dependent oxidoreductase [Burkholderia sp. L27(2015)]|uniref:NAD(P)-dependent oxidoreductase n=1 Tax=Burkholderia sp. L27(2015) TaxID=1641858 RepID=UPI00131BB3FC|nr:NAD(P)-dependent oxidoreductase [Burkholderia sp. L27(2015)]
MAKVGMVGLGLMGYGIATNLLKHGHSLVLFTHPGNQPLDSLIDAGAATTASLMQLASNVDVIVLCLTGTPEVEDVLFSSEGLLRGLVKGSTVVDCSTSLPSSSIKIAAAIKAVGGDFLDAPMTRTPKEAAEGRLNLTVGGNRATFNMLHPLLACFAENITYAGPVGSGHRLKLIHNFVSLGFSAILAEAAACARRTGITPDVLLEVLSNGGGAGVVLERFRPYLESGDLTSFRFYIANALKDMNYYLSMVDEAGVAQEMAVSVQKTYGIASRVAGVGAVVPELVDILALQL